MTFNPTPPPEPRLASTPFDDLGGTLDIAPSDGVIEQTLEHIPFHLALPDPHDQQGPPIAWWPLDDPFSNYSGIEPYQQPAQASQGVLGLSFESVAVPCEQAASQTRASRPFLSQECVASAIISGRGVTNVRYDSSPSRTHPPKHCRRASWQPQQNVGQPNRNETYPGHGSNTRPRYRMKDDSLRSKEDNRPKNMKFVPYAGPDIMTSSNVKVVEHERPQTTTRQSVSNSEVASRPPPATVVGGRESNPKKRRMDSPSLDDQEGVRTRKKMKRISSTPATQSAPSPSRSKVPPHSTTPSSDPSNGSSTALKNARGSRIQKTSPTDSRKKPFTWTGMILNCNGMPGKKNEWRHYS
ncbi:hypothetical protein BDZ97DRAFT_1819060 [Flammula alnicola]|nr:hypothetical protein BDZ97DRAFT_1819060 [Flammula alnicola]